MVGWTVCDGDDYSGNSAIYVGGVTYSYYQEEQERQEYQDDLIELLSNT